MAWQQQIHLELRVEFWHKSDCRDLCGSARNCRLRVASFALYPRDRLALTQLTTPVVQISSEISVRELGAILDPDWVPV